MESLESSPPAPAAEQKAAAAAPVDAREFARLFASEAPRVWRVLRRVGVPEADIDDVCQEVFLTVYQRWNEFRREASMRTWIYGIAVRKAIGHRRKKHVRDATSLSPAHEPKVAAAQHGELERGYERRVLHEALSGLGEGQREVFVLYELEELPMREVAEALELPLHTAYSRLYAARSLLAAELRRLTQRGAWP